MTFLQQALQLPHGTSIGFHFHFLSITVPSPQPT